MLPASPDPPPASPCTPEQIGFSRLPNEMLGRIAKHLELTELFSLRWASRGLFTVFSYYLPAEYKIKEICWAAQGGDMFVLKKVLAPYLDPAYVRWPRLSEDELGPFHHALYHYGDSVQDVIQLLFKTGFLAYPESYPLLDYACKYQNYGAAQALLRCGALFPKTLLVDCVSKIKAKSDGGYVPDDLVGTVSKFQRQLIEQLLSKRYCGKLDIDAADWLNQQEAETALICAVREGNYWAVEQLLESGADPDRCGGFGIRGTSPAMAAVVARNSEVLGLLFRYGAKTSVKDNDGKTACDYIKPCDIVDSNTEAIWKMLIERGLDLYRPQNGPEDYYVIEYAVKEAKNGNTRALDVINENQRALDVIKENRRSLCDKLDDA